MKISGVRSTLFVNRGCFIHSWRIWILDDLVFADPRDHRWTGASRGAGLDAGSATRAQYDLPDNCLGHRAGTAHQPPAAEEEVMELERILPNHLAVVGVAFAGFVATLEPGPWVPGDMLMGFG